MGLNLTLLVVECDCGHWGYAFTMLYIECDEELQNTIQKQNPFPRASFELHSYMAIIPDGSRKGEHGYGTVEETYGEQLTYLSVKHVLRAFDTVTELSKRARAIKAYLTELDETTLVGLYWH